jgi:hypothetical protein
MRHNPNAFRLDIQTARSREFEAAQTAAEVRALDEKWRREDDAVEQAQSAQARQAADHERRLAYLEDIIENQVGVLLADTVANLEKDLLGRITKVESVLGPGGLGMCDAITKGMGKVLRQAREQDRKEIMDRIAEVETKQLRFYGVHEPGRSYAANSMVVKKGGLWIALTATGTVPGSDDTWQLAVKSGEAGKTPAIA